MNHDMKKPLIGVVCCIALLAVVFALGMPKQKSTGTQNAGQNEASGGDAAGGIYTPGEYIGKGEGFGGSVKTTITVSGDAITDVVIEAETETAEIGQAAAAILAEQVLEVQGAEIDGVTGASLTSDAVRKGVEKALKEAKGE